MLTNYGNGAHRNETTWTRRYKTNSGGESIMAAKSFSAKEKRQITKDWNELFPEMGVYKNMWLLKIVGPIAVGILLEIGSNRDYYTPTVHFHDLSEEDESISLMGELNANFDYISTKSKPDKYLKVAEKLEVRSFIPLKGNLNFSELETCLLKYLDYEFCSLGDKKYVLRTILNLSILEGNNKKIQETIHFVKEYLNYLNHRHGMNYSIEDFILERDVLIKNIEENIIKLKLEKIPRHTML